MATLKAAEEFGLRDEGRIVLHGTPFLFQRAGIVVPTEHRTIPICSWPGASATRRAGIRKRAPPPQKPSIILSGSPQTGGRGSLGEDAREPQVLGSLSTGSGYGRVWEVPD